jgi:hypothetical protein
VAQHHLQMALAGLNRVAMPALAEHLLAAVAGHRIVTVKNHRLVGGNQFQHHCRHDLGQGKQGPACCAEESVVAGRMGDRPADPQYADDGAAPHC